MLNEIDDFKESDFVLGLLCDQTENTGGPLWSGLK